MTLWALFVDIKDFHLAIWTCRIQLMHIVDLWDVLTNFYGH
jgi:hypothetical protein